MLRRAFDIPSAASQLPEVANPSSPYRATRIFVFVPSSLDTKVISIVADLIFLYPHRFFVTRWSASAATKTRHFFVGQPASTLLVKFLWRRPVNLCFVPYFFATIFEPVMNGRFSINPAISSIEIESPDFETVATRLPLWM